MKQFSPRAKKPLFFLAIILSGLIAETLMVPSAHGVNANLKQEILPLDCVFDTVNDGSNTIIYLTPIECGIPIDGPKEPTSEPTVTIVSTETTRIFQIPLLLRNTIVTVPGGSQQLITRLYNEQVTTIQEPQALQTPMTQTSNPVPLVIIGIGIVAIVLILILILLF
jgi:hypothetical protein